MCWTCAFFLETNYILCIFNWFYSLALSTRMYDELTLIDFDLEYFDSITPISLLNMGYAALAKKSIVEEQILTKSVIISDSLLLLNSSDKNKVNHNGESSVIELDTQEMIDIEASPRANIITATILTSLPTDVNITTTNIEQPQLQQSQPQPIIKEYILKRWNKHAVFTRKYTRIIIAEAKILRLLNSPFISKLFGKFQTPNELILVLERISGGDMWSLIYEEEDLRLENGFMPMDVVKFYAGCIALGLEHMHDRNIVYRNLKPENVKFDTNGYVKLTAMGFAKKIPFLTAQGHVAALTFTFCGTLGTYVCKYSEWIVGSVVGGYVGTVSE